jgi:hypothetical protein
MVLVARQFGEQVTQGGDGGCYVSKTAVIAWGLSAAGTALWVYGYFIKGTPPLIDWHAHTPWWIADFLPNIQSEIVMVLLCLGTALVYWPPPQH